VRAMRKRLTPAGREGAATALGWLVAHHESPEALQALGTAAVLDRSDSVRLAAVRSLGRSPSVRATKLLYWVQAHASRPGVRAAVEQALREQSERHARLGFTRYQPPADEFGEVSSPIQSSALKRSVAVGLTFAALEFAGGVFTGNAVLKADALHLAGDRLLDATGIFALYLARRPPSARRTYGYIKAEAVFALLGALVIAGVALGMVPDVWHGLSGVYAWLFLGGAALPAAGWAVAAFASIGLASNLFSGFLLMRHREGSMTAKAAFLHVMADAMGSGGLILTTALGALLGWTFLQPFVFAFIVYLILHTAWELGQPAWNVLMDAVPPDLDLDQLERDFVAVPGVTAVYDLHVRQLNGSASELAAKAVVAPGADRDAALAALQSMLREKYKITHATIQLEAARP
jgi:cobalt-zinc-cadmium efflux system protein